MARASANPWLMLMHQLPATPSNVRVKVWRHLQDLGAVALKSSVYVLPNTDATREDFAWVAQAIRTAGGEASLCEARLVEGLDDDALRTLFTRAREADYRALTTEVRDLTRAVLPASRRRPPSATARTKALAALARLRHRFDGIAALDFFGAPGREAVYGLLLDLERRLSAASSHRAAVARPLAIDDYRKRTWVTRVGVHIDRIGSAWLIRRLVDPQATFKFVAPRGYAAASREVRFDMYEAEFTHDGDRCTFEVLLRAFGLDDPALRALAEVVHDVDLKDGKFDREETKGFERVIAGIVRLHADDAPRLRDGFVAFDALHAWFRQGRRKPHP